MLFDDLFYRGRGGGVKDKGKYSNVGVRGCGLCLSGGSMICQPQLICKFEETDKMNGTVGLL
jgi:hypothetical protein